MMRKYKYSGIAAVIAITSLTGLGLAQSANAAADYPQIQYGTVHSYTTNGNASVSTTDGGYNWCFNGNCNGRGNPLDQTGRVHSDTTGLYAPVATQNGGYDWYYTG